MRSEVGSERSTVMKLFIQNEMLLFEFYIHLGMPNGQYALLVLIRHNMTLADCKG